ncbi:hypothetical protein [Salegentibacter maritimus]|uniref:TLP18.3, Psb32 and MOLO-1 founding protein of phosphatase n=1 Tax=Salegentibacter maritimus TaxID=2794347 RepID=A0ABS0TLC3_9FLAO|nr:hypothetical protein [Salegentibacter maritimus]MBI6121452.1 hypothetical protein [Salegentibacter maritimus]
MNKILLLFFTIISLSCTSQKESNYADKLSDCLTENDIIILNEATSLFEKKLEEHYKRKNSNKNFKSYIEDLGSIPPNYDFSPEFYSNDKTAEIIQEMKENKTFQKIWTKYEEDNSGEEIAIVSLSGEMEEEPEQKELITYVLNPNGDYLKCLNSNYLNEPIKEVLNAQIKYGDLAPSIIAGAMNKKLKEEDFGNEMNKVVVAFALYYNMANLLIDNPIK